MNRHTDAGDASVTLLCATFKVSRAAYYAEAGRQRSEPTDPEDGKLIALPKRPRHTSAEVVLARIREVLARETSAAWGVRKVWATLRREGLKVSRRRVWAIMRANGLVLARDREPGETPRGHVTVPEPNRRIATDLTTVWTRRDGVVALVPTIDCGDRTAVIEVTKDQHGPAVLASVEAKLVDASVRRPPCPMASSCAPTTGRSTRAQIATHSASAGTSTTRTRRWAGRPATPSSSASSARSRRNSSGSVTGRAPTSSAPPSPPGCTTTTTTGHIRPSTGRLPWSAEPSASLRPSRAQHDPELACTNAPIPVRASVLTLGGHYRAVGDGG